MATGVVAHPLFPGIVVNLWAAIPSVHPGTNAKNYVTGLLQGVFLALLHADLLLQVHPHRTGTLDDGNCIDCQRVAPA
jgi:hypothetical protein